MTTPRNQKKAIAATRALLAQHNLQCVKTYYNVNKSGKTIKFYAVYGHGTPADIAGRIGRIVDKLNMCDLPHGWLATFDGPHPGAQNKQQSIFLRNWSN